MDDIVAAPDLDQREMFRHLIVANSQHWLACAQQNETQLLAEAPQVIKTLHFALSLTDAWHPARDLMRYLNPLMLRQGQGEVWEPLLNKAITQSAALDDPVELELRLALGQLYRLQGRLPDAQRTLQQALATTQETTQLYWTLLNEQALILRLLTHHEQAIDYCQQVLQAPQVTATAQAEALNVLGLVAHDRREWPQALDYYEQALSLYKKTNDNYHIARILTNRGVLFQQQKRLEEAEASCHAAIEAFDRAGDQAERYKAVMNLGNIFLVQQQYQAAINQYLLALPAFQRCNFMVDLTNLYNNLGMAYGKSNDASSAEAYFIEAVTLARNLGDPYKLANILDNFGKQLITMEAKAQARTQ
ncbi:MAG: tetratricopeptide repeat protein, partial [Chloroflexota bacterium]